MSNIYIYKDSFYSLLSLIDYLINYKIKPDNIKPSNYNKTLFENVIQLDLNYNNLNLIKNISKNNIKLLFSIFLSNEENKELIIYYYLINLLKYKENVIYMRNLKCVSEALRISKYVMHEVHKFKGFTRFRELDNNILYAEINPTNNIIFLLANHFKVRLKYEYWIIKDIDRNIFCIYNKKDTIFASGDEFKLLSTKLSIDEVNYQKLWINFYNIIGIKERKNDRCRMNFMPKKYWKYIIEMSDKK